LSSRHCWRSCGQKLAGVDELGADHHYVVGDQVGMWARRVERVDIAACRTAAKRVVDEHLTVLERDAVLAKLCNATADVDRILVLLGDPQRQDEGALVTLVLQAAAFALN